MDHWAWQVVVKPAVPEVDNRLWSKHPIDRFIYDHLQKNGLEPSQPADVSTLVRRASFDLLGLPPSFDEVSEMENASSEDAWEQLIERYLALPAYGERWGRHWLDVARYADTKGAFSGNKSNLYPYAYTYRDYVIEAFNADMPFDQFIIEQIAADKLNTNENIKTLAAMGFLTVGDRFRNKMNDIIDDRIDVVTRGFMALTVACARCHNHKFDPIPTRDYYSLYGVFASSEELKELPLIGAAPDDEAHKTFLADLAKQEQSIEDKIAELAIAARAQVMDQLALYLEEVLLGKNHEEALLRTRMVEWLHEAVDSPPSELQSVLLPAKHLNQLSDVGYEAGAKRVIAELKTTNAPVLAALTSRPIVSKQDVATIYGELFAEARKRWQQLLESNPEATALQDADWEQIRQVLYSPVGPIGRPDDEVAKTFGQAERAAIRKVKAGITKLVAGSDGAPPRAMVMQDKEEMYDPKVFRRGNDEKFGPSVPRQFLKLIAGDEREPFSKSDSGRLELAQAIASPDNPMTARVIVNRVWQWHFGIGLVPSSSNFGILGDRPSHPELLDYLAVTFIENGWSIKDLHRRIMHSETYRQRSQLNETAEELDARNQWLWRFSPHRLDFESTRDAFLAVSGSLDSSRGGRSVALLTEPYSNRRTVYGFMDRLDPPAVFRNFDMPSADSSIGVRSKTTAPQQALFLLNSPFVIEQARALAKRVASVHPDDPASQIEQLYRLAFSRSATVSELEQANTFLKAAEQEEFTPLEQLSQVMLCANEFVFLD